MKQLLLLFLLLLVGQINQLHAQWVNVTPPATNNIRYLDAVDKEVAYVLSVDSISGLQKTTDRGQTWTTLNLPDWNSPDVMYWDGLLFPDANNGFIYGTWLVNGGVFMGGTESFTLFSTSDGGQTWQDKTPPVPTTGLQYLNGIHFFNPQQGFATYSTGMGYTLVMTTDNGGSSWQIQDTLPYIERAVHLNADGSGIAIRYRYQTVTPEFFVYQIADFGKEWTLIGSPETDPDWAQHRIGLLYDDLYYLNNNLVFRWRQDLQGIGNQDDILYIDLSRDGGQTWQEDFFSITGEYINQFEPLQDAIWLQTWNDVLRRDFSAVSAPQPVLNDVKVAPNPATAGHRLILTLPNNVNTTLPVQLSTADGQLVRGFTLPFQDGKAAFTIPANLPSGIYCLQIQFEGKMVATRLMVQK